MEAQAIRKYIRSSPRKLRRVVNVVRGQNVAEALNVLHFLPQAATRPIELTIKSAVYNLMDQYQDERFDEHDLFIHEIRVDEGPKFKRFRPAPRGRAHPYHKRLSHLTVIVGTAREEDEGDEE
ncbi:MAG: 50S ribosomal protein L22 [Rhodothermales bacterium]